MDCNAQDKIKLSTESVYILNSKANNRELLDSLAEHLAKLEALIAIMNIDDFLDFDRSTIVNYFWTMRELVKQAGEITEMFYSRYSATLEATEEVRRIINDS